MRILETHVVPELTEKVRLSDYVPGIFLAVSTKKGMKKAITAQRVKVNNVIAQSGFFIKGGETIDLLAAKLVNKPVIKLNLIVLYEDDYLAIVNKPAGLIVSGNKRRTLENALPVSLKKSKQPDALKRAQPAHRLDYPTSGVLLIGKTANTITALNKLFENRAIEKTYYAITVGDMEKQSGKIDQEIKGKKAHTDYHVENSMASIKYKALNLVRLNPVTGRRHQLRVHMSEMGNPVFGEQMYATDTTNSKGNGLYLHAYSLKFEHPVSGETVYVEQPLPTKFNRIFNKEAVGEEA